MKKLCNNTKVQFVSGKGKFSGKVKGIASSDFNGHVYIVEITKFHNKEAEDIIRDYAYSCFTIPGCLLTTGM